MRILTTLFIFLFFNLVSFSQDTVQLFLHPANIKIGQQAELILQYTYKADNGKVEIVWPDFNDTIIDKIEIISKGEIKKVPADENKDPNLLLQKQTYIISSYDSGYYAIPPIPVIVNGDTLLSNPILFEVHTVPVDTTKAIKNIKGIYETELDWSDYFTLFGDWMKENKYVLIAILILLVLIIIAYIYYRKTRKIVTVVPQVIIPPHTIALGQLAELENKKLWQNGFVKEYHIELTDILRSYIEKRFLIHAMEQTTDEIMSQLRLTDISEISKLTLIPVLRLADLVKFAKASPIGNENDEMMVRARDFINSTIPAVKNQKGDANDI
jgi:hypothetical protein